jgi:dsRNA-specific ribonuclease
MTKYSRDLQDVLEKNIRRLGFTIREATDPVYSRTPEEYVLFAKRVLVDFCGYDPDRFKTEVASNERAMEDFTRCLTHTSFDSQKDNTLFSSLGTATMENAIVNWLASNTNILSVARGDYFVTEILQWIRERNYYARMAEVLGVDQMIRWRQIKIRTTGSRDEFLPLMPGEIMTETSFKALCVWIEIFWIRTNKRTVFGVTIGNGAVANLVNKCAAVVLAPSVSSALTTDFLATIRNPITKVKELIINRLKGPQPEYVKTQLLPNGDFFVTLNIYAKGCGSNSFKSKTYSRPEEGNYDAALQAVDWLQEDCKQKYTVNFSPIKLKFSQGVPLPMSNGIDELTAFGMILIRSGLPQPTVEKLIKDNHQYLKTEVVRALSHETALYKEGDGISGSFNYQNYEFLGDKVFNKAVCLYMYNRFGELRHDPLAVKKVDLVVGRIRGKKFVSEHLHFFLGITDPETQNTLIKWQPLSLGDGSWSLDDNPNGENMLEDTWESMIGLLNHVMDKLVFSGVGFGICYNFIASVLDTMPISIDSEQNETYADKKLKEWFDRIKESARPSYKYGKLYFGFPSDPLQQNKKTTYEVFFYRGAVVIKVTVDNYTVRFNGPIIDPALTEEVKGELQSRWYKKLPGEKVSLDAPDDYKEILYGVTYKWITKHLSWDDATGRLIAL